MNVAYGCIGVDHQGQLDGAFEPCHSGFGCVLGRVLLFDTRSDDAGVVIPVDGLRAEKQREKNSHTV